MIGFPIRKKCVILSTKYVLYSMWELGIIMDTNKIGTGMSASLMARNVYGVCFPERDNLNTLQSELAAARKKFFSRGKKTVRVGKSEIIRGFDGKLHGKMTRHGLYWKKSAGKIALEEAFDQKNGYAVVYRDLRGIITSRVFFDRNQLWIKSEYYEPWDSGNAQIIFKPGDTFDIIMRFDREEDRKHYRSTELHPLPYLSGTAEQSIVNARFGDPMLIVSTAEGEFCYCPKKEAQARKVALDEIKEGTIMLMPAWEIKDGALTKEPGEEETNLTFTSLEEYAKVEPGQEAPAEAASVPSPPSPPENEEAEEFREVEQAQEEELSQADREESEQEETIQEQEYVQKQENPAEESLPEEEKSAERAEEQPVESSSEEETPVLRDASEQPHVEIQNGQPVSGGIIPAETAVYRGEYADGKRDGFGSHFYKSGALSYAGFWKDDKRDGLGVSFRESDHALHIAKWENGKPGSFVSLFDKDGNLRYGGHMVDGKKQGAGVSFRQDDGTIFVGKWENGEPLGLGSSFDKDGNLLYYGEWKDGKRNGHGTEFDPSGAIIFDGEWKDDQYHNGILYQKRKETEEEGFFPEEE